MKYAMGKYVTGSISIINVKKDKKEQKIGIM